MAKKQQKRGKLHDVLVVEVESLRGERTCCIEFAQQLVIEFRLAVFVRPLQHRVFEVARQCLQVRAAEELQDIMKQDKSLL